VAAERLTWEHLRELAAFRASRGCAVSLYLDLDPSSLAPTAGDVQTRLSSLLVQAERKAGKNEARKALRADLVSIGSELCLAPLVPAADTTENVLVAAVGRERGQLFRLRGGRLVEIADLGGDVSGRHDHGFEVAVHKTLVNGGRVHVVCDRRDLGPVGGVAALLRY